MTQLQLILAGGAVGVVATNIAGPMIKGLGKGTVSAWRWFTKMPNFEEYRRPHWLHRFRWWWNSKPEQRLTLWQWVRWHFICRIVGHHFPRGLENNAGYWNRGVERWFGVCDRCTGMVKRGTQEALDKAERWGAAPIPIPRQAWRVVQRIDPT
jgi:hypothetical protein